MPEKEAIKMSNTKATPLVEQIARDAAGKIFKLHDGALIGYSSDISEIIQAAIEKALHQAADQARKIFAESNSTDYVLCAKMLQPFEEPAAQPHRSEAVSEVIKLAQAILTALNTGDIESGSALHLKLREVMITYRENQPASGAASGEHCPDCKQKLTGDDMLDREVHGRCSAAIGTPTACSPGRVASSEAPKEERGETQELEKRISDYLSSGGLFNPEMMEHDKVRELIIDCRDALAAALAQAKDQPVTDK